VEGEKRDLSTIAQNSTTGIREGRRIGGLDRLEKLFLGGPTWGNREEREIRALVDQVRLFPARGKKVIDLRVSHPNFYR